MTLALTLSDEQAMLREAAATWVRDRAPVAALRALRANGHGFDHGLYREMAEMGWPGVALAEAEGGFGFGFAGLGLLAEELGRNLVASPLIGSAALGASALALAGSDAQKRRWLPALLTGEAVAALALDEGIRHDPAATALAARRTANDQWRLTGTKRPVFDGGDADLLLVVARTSGAAGDPAGLTLFLCPADNAGLAVTRLRQIDSRGAAIVAFDGVALADDAVLGEVDRGAPLLERVLDRGRAVLAAEMLGSAQGAFDTTIDYLKTRVQFGKPIGAFQALQHRAADMLGQLELTRSAVRAALAAIDAGDPDEPRLVSLAKATAGVTLRKVAQEMVQMHGGIGMTEEHDAGLYLKRAHVADMTFGNVAYHRDRYASLSGL